MKKHVDYDDDANDDGDEHDEADDNYHNYGPIFVPLGGHCDFLLHDFYTNQWIEAC